MIYFILNSGALFKAVDVERDILSKKNILALNQEESYSYICLNYGIKSYHHYLEKLDDKLSPVKTKHYQYSHAVYHDFKGDKKNALILDIPEQPEDTLEIIAAFSHYLVAVQGVFLAKKGFSFGRQTRFESEEEYLDRIKNNEFLFNLLDRLLSEPEFSEQFKSSISGLHFLLELSTTPT